MIQTILPGSCKKINFYQELLILFWKFCDYNKKFLYYVLKSSEVLDIFVPILYFLIDSRDDTSKIGLMHICVFILLLLSGERNFGVRLNKPYVNKFPIDVPVFSGTHGDLLIIVFHKLITTTGNRLQPLYDCLLTIIANISPYLKSLSMVTSTKVLHLLEAFSNPTFLFSNQTNYYLIFFLLEILNNIIQYQFDGNSNMIYTIIRKRLIFYNLLNLQTDQKFIDEALAKLNNKKASSSPTITTKNNNNNGTSASSLNIHVSPNTSSNLAVKSSDLNEITNIDNAGLKTTLAETPAINKMTENTISCLNTNVKEENSTASSIEKNNKLFEKNIGKYEIKKFTFKFSKKLDIIFNVSRSLNY
jgi:metal-responsive CopG/Arc/MetJ family transcriptional regulator